MSRGFVIARASISIAMALLIALGSMGAFGADVALAKKKKKNVVEEPVVEIEVCHILRLKKRSGATLGENLKIFSDDKALKDTERWRRGTCELLGIPTSA